MRIAHEELSRPRAADFHLRDVCRSVLRGVATNAMWITYGLFTMMALVLIAKDSATAGSPPVSGARWILVSEWSDAQHPVPPIGTGRSAATPLRVFACAGPVLSAESPECAAPNVAQTVNADVP